MTYDPNYQSPPGAPNPPQQPPPIPPQGYSPPPPYLQDAASKKLAAGLCGILVGTLGIHKFILGYTNAGLIMLLSTILTCGIAGIAMHVIGLIEGIMYLTKTDQQFYNEYIAQRKEWF